jgi:hypothetical protein
MSAIQWHNTMDAMLVAPEIIHINHSSKIAASQKTPPPDITMRQMFTYYEISTAKAVSSSMMQSPQQQPTPFCRR